MPQIPEPLQEEDFRFIKVAENQKRPFESDWQNTANYKYNDPEITQHLQQGGNYGVCGGYGNLIIIDCDQQQVENAVEAQLPDTLKVRSGGGGAHYYFICKDLKKAIRLKDNAAGDLGDVQSTGKQAVGPTSNHPSGGTYEIEKENPIAEITSEQVKVALKDFIVDQAIDPEQEREQLEKHIDEEYELDIRNIVDAKLKTRGSEAFGAHPIHGSSSKPPMNFWINTAKNTWHCFRHDTGGGPLSWIAVKHGIISCEEATKGGLNGSDFKKTLEIGREKYGLPEPKEKHGKPQDWQALQELYEDKEIKTDYANGRAAEMLLEQMHFKTEIDTEKLWVFTNPIYEAKGPQFVKRELGTNLSTSISSRNIKEVTEKIKAHTYTERPSGREYRNIIPLKNGYYHRHRNEFTDPNPDYFITNELPIEYDEDADCPKIKEFLTDVLGEEMLPLMQEIFGYLLYKDYPIAKAFMFHGPGKNGKSQVLELMQRFVGEKNIATPSIQELTGDDFAKAELFGKLANICGDLDAKTLHHSGNFKTLTGQDLVRAQEKYGQPFSFKNYAKLLYSANELPKTEDDSDAFFRRWIIIDFPFRFTENPTEEHHKKKVPNIVEKITTDEEMSGLFNWAVKGLDRLLDNGQFTKTQSTEWVKKKWLMASQPLDMFVEMFVDVEVGEYVTTDEFYEMYCNFCDMHKAEIQNKRWVGRRLKELIPQMVKSRKRVLSGNRARVYENITFKNKVDSSLDKDNGLSQSSNHFLPIAGAREESRDINTSTGSEKSLDFRDRGTPIPKRLLNLLRESDDAMDEVEIQEELEIAYDELEPVLKKLSKDGDIFEPKNGYWKVL